MENKSGADEQKEIQPKSELRKNRDWIKKHQALYRGWWIALRDGELMATGVSLKEVEEKLNGERCFITKIF